MWSRAYSLHVWGSHEMKLDVEDVAMDVPHVEWLLRYAKQLAKRLARGSESRGQP